MTITRSIRLFCHGAIIGIGSLACLTIGLHTIPPKVSHAEIIESLALVLDGEEIIDPRKIPKPRPTPKSKLPEMGYTEEFRQQMSILIGAYN